MNVPTMADMMKQAQPRGVVLVEQQEVMTIEAKKNI
jgi:hypothetical protein